MSFEINDSVLVKYNGNDSHVDIPDGVTSIGDSEFSFCSSLTSITIPDSVTSIGKYAFSYCSSLTSITIPDSVTSIGDSAFYCSSLTSITIPDSVTNIGDDAFNGCSGLKDSDGFVIINNIIYGYYGDESKIVIPDSVISIGNQAFDRCNSLTSITIPDSVTSIGKYAFSGCSNTKIIFKQKDKLLFSIYGDNYKEDIVRLTRKGKYDEVFELIKNLTSKILFIAGIINNPINLSEETLEEYKTYLKKNALKAVRSHIDENDTEMINWMLEGEYLSKAGLQKAIDYSSENKKTEITAILLDYQNRRFPPKKTVKKLSL